MSRRSIRTELHSRQQLSGRSANTPDSRNKEEPSYQPATKVSTRNQGIIFLSPTHHGGRKLSPPPRRPPPLAIPPVGELDRELDAAISALRSLGYTLGNLITGSDLRFDLLHPNSSYTLFAPSDSALFSPADTFFHSPCPNPPAPPSLPSSPTATSPAAASPQTLTSLPPAAWTLSSPVSSTDRTSPSTASPASSSSTATRPAANHFLPQDRPISVSLRTRPPIRLRSRLRLRLPPRSSS